MNRYSRYTFKAKRKDNGEWVYGYYWLKKDYVCFANEENNKHYIRNQRNIDWGITDQIDYEIIPDTLCQCTGLQDRNGKDIFENDIVELNDKFDGIFETNVVFKNGCFGIDMSVVKQIKNPNGWDKNYDKCESFGMNTSKYKTLTKENSDMISGFGYHTDNCKIIKNKFDKEED